MGYVKLKTVQVEGPAVIALGTSRVMPFRESFFGTRFFNAGSGAYQQFVDLLAFLQSIPIGREPKAIVLGLDQKFFNERWTEHMPDPSRPAARAGGSGGPCCERIGRLCTAITTKAGSECPT